jgi:hypothetical protein
MNTSEYYVLTKANFLPFVGLPGDSCSKIPTIEQFGSVGCGISSLVDILLDILRSEI